LPLPRRLILSTVFLVWGVVIPAMPQTAKAPPKKTATAPKSAPAKSKTTPAKSKTTTRKRAPARPLTQQQPTPERNKEIQQALIDKGYLQDPPTGNWDTQSSEALKRFQADQQLQATGKLDSLSLIRLGLGPKRQALTPASLPTPPTPAAKP
jgi:peptidoglycan hydrolase-like protein with peptidoglycan-binding domain